MISVLGATSWGTTLALVIARAGRPVTILARSPEEAARIDAARENPRLPGIRLPDQIRHTADPAEALDRATIVILGVPAQTMRANVTAIADALPAEAILVNVAKGIEIATSQRMSEVIAAAAPHHADRIATLSGPNLAKEIAAGRPAATVIAARNASIAMAAQDQIQTPTFRTYTSTDLTGVELGGALKNVIALVAGISDGLNMGDNAKASVITRGLAEMTRLGVANGAQPLTFAGLSGLGDLVATCASSLSRNHQVGARLATGETLDSILRGLGAVAEGVPTTKAAQAMGARLGVELPITDLMYHVLFADMPVTQAVAALLTRSGKAEFA